MPELTISPVSCRAIARGARGVVRDIASGALAHSLACRGRRSCPTEPVDIRPGPMHNSRTMNLAELLEQQAMALPPDERKKLGAKLIASVVVEQPPRRRRAGSAAGRVHMAPDFDAPLEDFAEYS